MKDPTDSSAPGANPDPLLALQAGDRGPFEAYVAREAGLFAAYFRRLGASSEEAEDLTQELFLKLFQNVQRYQPQEKFTAFSMRLAKNIWIDRRRRLSVRPDAYAPLVAKAGGSSGAAGSGHSRGSSNKTALQRTDWVEQEGDENVPNPAEFAAFREDVQRLQVALKELSPAHREAFDLALVRELPYANISKQLDIPVGTVKSRVFHALRKLRELMEWS